MLAINKNILILLTLFTISHVNGEFKLTVLHTNDMHSRILETNRNTGTCTPPGPCYGGFARVAHMVKEIKSLVPNTLFLNAGDTYQGSPLYSIFKWKVLINLMHMLGIDAMSLGNHEFDDGVNGLVPYLQKIRIPIVTCNLDTTEEPSLTNHTALKPWHMLEVEGHKIAVIGYLTPDTKFLSSTGNVKFLDEIEMITKYSKDAKEAGAKLIFAVGHSGYFKDQEIAKKVPDVDLVVGGHTDTFLYTGTPPDIEKPASVYPLMIEQDSGKKVPVVQAYGYTKYLGKLDLVWDDDLKLISATGNPILLDSEVPKEESVEDEITIWYSKLNGTLQQVKGATKVLLDGQCRLKECNFGNFVADAFLHYVANESRGPEWTEAPIVLFNGGAIRTSIQPSANVTWGDLLTVMPFANQLVRLKMKGSTLLKTLQHSVERYDLTRKVGLGEFLQVSGVKVEYVQGEDGKLKIKEALVRCKSCSVPTYEKIIPDKEYSVVTTIFVSEGGDGYYMLKDEAEKMYTYDKTDLDILAAYMLQMSPVYPEEEKRIIIPENLELIVGTDSTPLKQKSSSNMLTYNIYILFISFLLLIKNYC